jgi:hypothetical protein
MTKYAFLPLAAALTVSVAAPALASPAATDAPVVLEHEGHRYVYTVAEQGDARIIRGIDELSGKRFTLRVRGDRVRGEYGSTPVSFRASQTQGTAATMIAAR